MGLSRPLGANLATTYNSVYNITLDLSGWDKTTVEVIGPSVGTTYIYGTNDGGALQSVRYGDAAHATNFNPIQATRLSDSTKVNSIAALSAGQSAAYEIDVNEQFLRLQGSPNGAGSSIYRINIVNYKIG